MRRLCKKNKFGAADLERGNSTYVLLSSKAAKASPLPSIVKISADHAAVVLFAFRARSRLSLLRFAILRRRVLPTPVNLHLLQLPR